MTWIYSRNVKNKNVYNFEVSIVLCFIERYVNNTVILYSHDLIVFVTQLYVSCYWGPVWNEGLDYNLYLYYYEALYTLYVKLHTHIYT